MRVLTSIDKGDGKFVWERSGSNIEYSQNNYLRENNFYSRYYYTLTFEYDFKQAKSCYFAYCYPYTYTDLKQHLAELMADTDWNKNVTK